MIDIRRPPDFPHEADVVRGMCAICGTARPKKRRRYCSDACSDIGDYPWHPRWAAWKLAIDTFGERVTPRCFGCGLTSMEARTAHNEPHWPGGLELEHIRPLWSLNDTERGELKWWLPFNLQLLCRWCHKVKTAREAGDRWIAQNPDGSLAKKRRIAEHGYDPLEPQLPLIPKAS